MTVQTQPIAPTQEIPTDTKFWEIYQGNTATSFGQVSKQWRVLSYEGNGVYRCKPITDNTVGRLNPEYTETFTAPEIKKILKDQPIVGQEILNLKN